MFSFVMAKLFLNIHCCYDLCHVFGYFYLIIFEDQFLTHMNNKSIAEFVKENQNASKVFDKYGIDYCCGGKMNFKEYCVKKNLDPILIINEIDTDLDYKGQISFKDINKWPADLICDYIEKTHHRYLKEFFEIVETKMEKLINKHGFKHPELIEIRNIIKSAQYELLMHLKKEELILFPAIKKIVTADFNNLPKEDFPFGSIANPINAMENEHNHEGERLELLKKLTNNFTPPDDACQTYQSVYRILKEFYDDMHKHVYIENHILFPKVLSLEKI